MTLVYHWRFNADLDEAVSYYEQQREGLGHDFAREVYQTIEAILDNPFLSPTRSNDVRRVRLKRFKMYAVRSRVLEDKATIRMS